MAKYEFDWVEEDKLAEKDIKAGRVKRYSSSEYLNALENRINQQEKKTSINYPSKLLYDRFFVHRSLQPSDTTKV